MSVKVVIVFVDGGYVEYDEELGILAKHDRLVQEGKAGKSLIDGMFSNDWAAPPRKVTIRFHGHPGQQTIELFYT